MSRSSLPPSSSAGSRPPADSPAGPDGPVTTRTPHKRKLSVRVAAVSRWLHIYLSMFGLFVLLFFSVTGVTLNHPDWFGGAERTSDAEGSINPRWLKDSSGATTDNPGTDVARLEIVEHLRKAHGVRGALVNFNVEGRECVVTFKGPGYSADAFIDRENATYRLTQTSHGLVAVINDLHKGRDTGPTWSVVIDLSAILMILASLSGLILLFYIKRRRVPGLFIALIGTAIVVGIVIYFVP